MVPAGTVIAHKFGEWGRERPEGFEQQFHDCGIVYRPGRPYLACVMTRGRSLPTLVDLTDPAMPEGLTFMLMTEPSESAPLMASQQMVDEVLRVRQRGRLEVSVLEKVTGRTYAQMRAEGFWYEQVLNAANDHYGHDLLTERDKRVAAGEGSKTWVSRRLTDEVGQIPEVAELIRLFDEQQAKGKKR